MKPRTKKILRRSAYALSVVIVLAIVGAWCAFQYFKSEFFRDQPNTLVFQGELHPVPFRWSADKSEAYTEPHGAILIPVRIPGISNKLYMQFDTGSPTTFLRSGALKSLKSRGIEFELLKTDRGTCIKRLEIDVAGNRVLLESGWVRGRGAEVDWNAPDAIHIIGSFGADFLNQKVCEIDFPAQEIRLHRSRPDAMNDLGEFTPFEFKGRRIMLPANINGSDVELFYDSGCSAFGLLTSKYHYDRLTDPNDDEIAYGANRFGESIPVHHKPSDIRIQLGSTEIPLKRISYAEMYNFLQVTVGRFIGGGFFGNKSLTESTLILDTNASEFLVVKRSLAKMTNGGPKRMANESENHLSSASGIINSTIPFRLTRWNNVSVPAIVNKNFAVNLMFHTAADDASLITKTLEKLPEIELDLEAAVKSWGGESTTRLVRGIPLSLGPVQLDDVTIFQSTHSGHHTDGKFGPRHLKSQFIEVNFDHSEIRLHQTLPEKLSSWERLAITIEDGMMFVNGKIHHGENTITQRFMIHSGYSGFALLDDEFVAKHKYVNELDIIDESELTDSGGNQIKTRKSSLPQFSLGSTEFRNVPVSFFDGAIGRQKFSVLGGDFLKRFNLVFDLENRALYLNKSQHFEAAHF